MSIKNVMAAAQQSVIFSGEQLYTTPGTYLWYAPMGVTSVSVVCVGGGGYSGGYGASGAGLAWSSNRSVTPGSSYQVVVGAGATVQGTAGGTSSFASAVIAYGGIGSSTSTSPAGGSFVGQGGGAGGAGGTENWGYRPPGAGGAGGYSGTGGRGSNSNTSLGTAGTGGAGGGSTGGFSPTYYTGSVSGGGVGLYGAGTSGVAGSGNGPGAVAAGAGSNGETGVLILVANGEPDPPGSQPGANYGSGGCGTRVTRGGNGGVRIIWGPGRSFPSNAA